jgi:uncharacterized protein involved in exopolysaccharide biosynthesis
MEENDNIIYVSESKTSIIDFYQLLKADFRKILKILAVFLVIGLFIALGSPTKYTSSCTVMPIVSNNTNIASSLLNQFGVGDLGFGQSVSGDDISPEIYPRIFKSTYFLLDLFDKEFMFSKYGEEIKLKDYYYNYRTYSLTEKFYRYTLGLYVTVRRYVAGQKAKSQKMELDKEVISINYKDKEYLELISESIYTNYESRTGLINIGIVFDDRVASADILNYTLEYLTTYITNYKTEKARIDLEFIEERLKDAEERFLKAQNDLATFQDQNLYISSAKFQTEEERLKSEFNIAFNLYNTLTQQQIHASIKVQENTPVFTVIDPIRIPIEKSSPKRIITMIVFFILGSVAGIISVIMKQYFKKLKTS